MSDCKTISVNGHSFRVAAGTDEGFWAKVDSKSWEPGTYDTFDAFCDNESVALDIGAWVGSTAFYLAQVSARCIAFEPDPISFAKLEANLACNADAPWRDRLEIRNAAVNATGESLKIGSREGGGDSMTSALFADRDASWEVPGSTVSAALDGIEQTDKLFLKIDIEGGEYELVPSIRDTLRAPGTRAHISLHPKFLRLSLEAGSLGALARRRAFIAAHLKLLDTLPRDRVEIVGRRERRQSRLEAIARAVLLGSFPRTLLLHPAPGH